MSALGLSLADLLRWQSLGQPAPIRTQAKSCILIWLDGGPSHLDTFDPKPDAPSEIRSAFKAIATSVDGLQICEHLSRTAAQMKHVALIRSITHELGNHDTGATFMLTGRRPTPALQYPSFGSILARELRGSAVLPPYVAIPQSSTGSAGAASQSGYLGAAFAPFDVGADPAKVNNLALPEGLRLDRLERRKEWLDEIDRVSELLEQGASPAAQDPFYQQAWRLLASPQAKAAFDLSQEKPTTRDAYGHSRIGQGCLLARRLVEAGAPMISIVDTGWDTHQQIFRELPDTRFPGSGKLPALDRAYATLLADLHDRGLLSSTLVLLMGEFGRTPKLNSQGGRDHWPRAGFAAVAGGGVRGGQVIGATDAHGESPIQRPVSPADLFVSVLTLLGVDPNKEYLAPGGRPLKLAQDGSFVRELT